MQLHNSENVKGIEEYFHNKTPSILIYLFMQTGLFSAYSHKTKSRITIRMNFNSNNK